MENNENKNKFESNKKYFTISIYTICVFLVCAIGLRCILRWDQTSRAISIFMQMLSPFIVGAFLAYVLSPMVKKIDYYLFQKICKSTRKKMNRILSILLSYVVVLGLITLFFVYIIPQLKENITNLIVALSDSYDKIASWLQKMEYNYPEINLTSVEKALDNIIPTILDTLKNMLSNALPAIYNVSVSVIKAIFNLIISIIVSCYILSDHNLLIKNFKRLIYAVLSEKNADALMKTLKECDSIFGGFIVGKIIDSLIIGALCLGLLNIFHMEFALLISLIVGITNMIPYFGPFIGAIPGAFLTLMANPSKTILFLILILVLQQFDGLFLGPKILGDSTGLRPLWIIFAITIGGWAAGPVGMFLGVPVIAVISFLLDKLIMKNLEKKKVDPSHYLPEDKAVPELLEKKKKSKVKV